MTDLLADVGDDPKEFGEPLSGAAAAELVGGPTDERTQLGLGQPV